MINFIIYEVNRITADVWHNRPRDYPLTMQGSARPRGMEPARPRKTRSGRGNDRASARSRHKRAAPRDPPSDSSRIRSGRRRVYRRERRRPGGAPKEAAAEEKNVAENYQTNPILVANVTVARSPRGARADQVHRRERWGPRGATSEAASEEELDFSPMFTPPNC